MITIPSDNVNKAPVKIQEYLSEKFIKSVFNKKTNF